MKHQSGRSMVEILGVLAIVGVLSVGGLTAYRYAMNKKFVNDLIYDLNLADTEIMTDGVGPELAFGDEIDLDVFEDEHPNLVFIKTYDIKDGQIVLPEEPVEPAEDASAFEWEEYEEVLAEYEEIVKFWNDGFQEPYLIGLRNLTVERCEQLFTDPNFHGVRDLMGGDEQQWSLDSDEAVHDFCVASFGNNDEADLAFNFSFISSAWAEEEKTAITAITDFLFPTTTDPKTGTTTTSDRLGSAGYETQGNTTTFYVFWGVDVFSTGDKGWSVPLLGLGTDSNTGGLKIAGFDTGLFADSDSTTKAGGKTSTEESTTKANANETKENQEEVKKEKTFVIPEFLSKKGLVLVPPNQVGKDKPARINIFGFGDCEKDHFRNSRGNCQPCSDVKRGSGWDKDRDEARKIEGTDINGGEACYCPKDKPYVGTNACEACASDEYATIIQERVVCKACPKNSDPITENSAFGVVIAGNARLNSGCKCRKDHYAFVNDEEGECRACPVGKYVQYQEGDALLKVSENPIAVRWNEKSVTYGCVCKKPEGREVYINADTNECATCPEGMVRKPEEYFQNYKLYYMNGITKTAPYEGTPDNTHDYKTNTYCGCPIEKPYWDGTKCSTCDNEITNVWDQEQNKCIQCKSLLAAGNAENSTILDDLIKDNIFYKANEKWYYVGDTTWYSVGGKYPRYGMCVGCPENSSVTKFREAKGSWFGFSVGASGLIYDLNRADYPFDFVHIGSQKYGCACAEGYYFDKGSAACKPCDDEKGERYSPLTNKCDSRTCTATVAKDMYGADWDSTALYGGRLALVEDESLKTDLGISIITYKREWLDEEGKDTKPDQLESYRCDANSNSELCLEENCIPYSGDTKGYYCDSAKGLFPNPLKGLTDAPIRAIPYKENDGYGYKFNDKATCGLCPVNSYLQLPSEGEYKEAVFIGKGTKWGIQDYQHLAVTCQYCGDIGKYVPVENRKKAYDSDVTPTSDGNPCVCMPGTSLKSKNFESDDVKGAAVTLTINEKKLTSGTCYCKYAGQFWDESINSQLENNSDPVNACVCPRDATLFTNVDPLEEVIHKRAVNVEAAKGQTTFCACPENKIWSKELQQCICDTNHCSNNGVGGFCEALENKPTEYRNEEDGTCTACVSKSGCEKGPCFWRAPDNEDGTYATSCASCWTKTNGAQPNLVDAECQACPADKPKWAKVHDNWDLTGLFTSEWQCTVCPEGEECCNIETGEGCKCTMDFIKKRNKHLESLGKVELLDNGLTGCQDALITGEHTEIRDGEVVMRREDGLCPAAAIPTLCAYDLCAWPKEKRCSCYAYQDEEGKLINPEDSKTCNYCPKGTYVEDNTCKKCPENHYWSGEENNGFAIKDYDLSVCTQCPLGMITPETCQGDVDNCCYCPDGTSKEGKGYSIQFSDNGEESPCRCEAAGQNWDGKQCVCPGDTKIGGSGEYVDGDSGCACPFANQVFDAEHNRCVCADGYVLNAAKTACEPVECEEYEIWQVNSDGITVCVPCGESKPVSDDNNRCTTCVNKYGTEKPYWDKDAKQCKACPADKPKWNGSSCEKCPDGTVYGQTSDGTMDCVEKQTDECTRDGDCGPDQFCLTEGWLLGQSDEVQNYFKNNKNAPKNRCYEKLSEAGRACAPEGMYGCRTQFGGQYAIDHCGKDENSWYHPCPGGTYNDDSKLCPIKGECKKCPPKRPYSHMQTTREDKCFSCPDNAVAQEVYGGSDVNSGQWVYASNGRENDCYCKTSYYAVNGNKNCCLNRQIWKDGKCVDFSCPANSEKTDAPKSGSEEKGVFKVDHPVNSDPNYAVWCKCVDGKTWDRSACV